MITHYKVGKHLACGRHGSNLIASTELARVKCRNCKNTDVFKEARRDARNAARRAARQAKAAHSASDWRSVWVERLRQIPGRQRLPRGFGNQPYV
ncbi:hypothetical protein Pres01_17400 [Metapseudomonas resinovorans]|uniref:hypothetical protein n=1 Tax=Metapseudomonas resinovorans TaxID=53412 RepID=UPI0009840A42|nr:hypothetical protein [Pseudomonas resinovorans]GLZ85689.1 hypothetical protein Pres01_17400 [Pseudomonas resinovorans]